MKERELWRVSVSFVTKMKCLAKTKEGRLILIPGFGSFQSVMG